MNHRYKVLLAFAIVYVVWGSTYLAIRVGIEYIPSALFAGARFFSAGALLLLGLTALRRPIRPSARDLGTLAVAAFLLLVTGNGLVFLAEKMVASGPAALVIATVPLWTAALEAVLPGGERLSARGAAGIVLGLVGLAALSWPELARSAGQGINLIGVAILIFASLSWSSGTLLVRRRPVTLDPFAATGWEMLLGGVFNLILGAILQGREPITWHIRLLGAWAYLTVFGSIVAFTAYIWLVKNAPPAKVTTYAYVNPVIAVFLGWWLLREPLNGYVLGGMAIILLAVVLVTGAKVRPAPPPKPEVITEAPPRLIEKAIK